MFSRTHLFCVLLAGFLLLGIVFKYSDLPLNFNLEVVAWQMSAKGGQLKPTKSQDSVSSESPQIGGLQNKSVNLVHSHFLFHRSYARGRTHFRLFGSRTLTSNRTMLEKALFEIYGLPLFNETTFPAAEIPSKYKLVVISHLARCMTNYWHGMIEVILPLFTTVFLYHHQQMNCNFEDPTCVKAVVKEMLRAAASHEAVLLFKAPGRSIWSGFNSGCPTLNSFPYGISTNSLAGWMALALFRKFNFSNPKFSETPSNVGVEFFAEPPETKKYPTLNQRMKASFKAEQAIVGLSPACRYNTLTGFPHLNEWPWYVGPSICHIVFEAARLFYLKVMGLNRFVQPISQEELQCPKVLFIDRQDSDNGRSMLRFYSMIDNVRAKLPKCANVTSIKLESGMAFREQVELIASATILAGPRGMGMISATYLRPRAGLVIYSGVDRTKPASVEADNYLWNPFPVFRRGIATVLRGCAVAPKNVSSVSYKRCLYRSINFCDLNCSATQFVEAVERVLRLMKNMGDSNDSELVYDVPKLL